MLPDGGKLLTLHDAAIYATTLPGGDRKALTKELSNSRAMTRIFAERSAEKRREGGALIREADNLACQSWNEKLWSDVRRHFSPGF